MIINTLLISQRNPTSSIQQNNDLSNQPDAIKTGPVAITAKNIEVEKPKKSRPISNITDTDESSFSEKLADAADKMDSFQEKLRSRFFKSKD